MKDENSDSQEPGRNKGEWKMEIIPEQEQPDEMSGKTEPESTGDDDLEGEPEKMQSEQAEEKEDSRLSGMMSPEIPSELKKNPMSFIINSMICIVVLLLLYGLYHHFSKQSSDDALTGTAEMRLTFKSGEVKHKKGGKNEWAVMQENELIKAGDQIQTALSDKNVISIGEGCNIRLSDVTLLEINSFNAADSITGSFTLNSGKLWINNKNFQELKVFADSGIFTAGNSVFNLILDPAKGAVIEVLQGSVYIASATDPTMTIPVKAGEKASVKGSNIEQPTTLTLDASNAWYAWNIGSDSRENLVYKQNGTLQNDASFGNQNQQGSMQAGQPRMEPGQQGQGMMQGGPGQMQGGPGQMQGGQGQMQGGQGMMQGGQGQMQGGQGQMQGGQGQMQGGPGQMQGGQGQMQGGQGQMQGRQGQGGMMQGGPGQMQGGPGQMQGGQGQMQGGPGQMQGGQGQMQGGPGQMQGGQGMMQGGQGQMQGGPGQMQGGPGQMQGGPGQMQGGQGDMEPGAGPGAGNEKQGGMMQGGQGGMQPGYGPNQNQHNYTQNMMPQGGNLMPQGGGMQGGQGPGH